MLDIMVYFQRLPVKSCSNRFDKYDDI